MLEKYPPWDGFSQKRGGTGVSPRNTVFAGAFLSTQYYYKYIAIV